MHPARFFLAALTALSICLTASAAGATEDDTPEHPLSDIPLRSIGPALTSGRVADFAFHPVQREIHYVAMASGGVWKTVNDGITWEHVFSKEGAYATGVVALDPANPDIVWVGSGENNSQRSVGYGDGVYRSLDAGKSWQNMGLKDSGHISMIRFDPRDAQVVFVAAQGPLWSPGGDRGLYRSNDGGKNWERILYVDKNTGINEFLLDARNPDVILASSYQRRRHVWTLINGGPGSGVHKSLDSGKTWRRISSGLPEGELGRIGLAAAPSAPAVVYAIVEATEKDRGVYRSEDFGENWVKQSELSTTSPQYYNELIVDPQNPDRVYAVDTFTQVSEDAGKTWIKLSFENRHVDDHALWIDPENTDHLFIGGDGGVFESWDRGQKWRHVQNLPTTQFYRATPDNAAPFYNICGGTQDNQTLCGPSRNTYADGITNADWWIAQFGDGFKARIDPTDPNVIYAQYQHGGLVRFDRVSGERLAITPQPPAGVNDYKWNWNSPLIISPHDHRRLYFGSERLFRSDDRGESWVAVSGDLSRQIDRNQLEVMGRIWSVDAIAKNASTSLYGSMIALDESPLVEGLLYAGTDDGLIHVSPDGGQSWARVEHFKGVPDMSLVEDIIASRHDAGVAYAVIDNHKRGDFKPYVLKTIDRGQVWFPISGDLPARGSAHAIVEDHVDPNLLFVGTEFGLFFSQDGGESWNKMESLPTISVSDLEIQRRENDLVVGTFGLGFYILDDLSPLRTRPDGLSAEATLFTPRDTWIFIPDSRRGWGGKGDYGFGRYSGANPDFGAIFSYYLADDLLSLKAQRQKGERERAEKGEDTPYPQWDRLKQEDLEEDPAIILTVRDSDGQVVRRVSGPVTKGFHRVAWDLRYPAPEPINLEPLEILPWEKPPLGALAVAGTYQVTLSKRVEGKLADLAGPQPFVLKPMFSSGLVGSDQDARLRFELEAAELYRAVAGADHAAGEVQTRIDHLKVAVDETPGDVEDLAQETRALDRRLRQLRVSLSGDTTRSSRYEPVPPSISARIGFIIGGSWDSQSAITPNFIDSLAVARSEFTSALAGLKALSAELARLEAAVEESKAPWTPGRIPDWP
ncbi:MAG TPA: hypothetical protein VI566_04960 [Xanthomonadales bacterium]|nr:hypothetical protein [Xanthomonadales bacterium]